MDVENVTNIFTWAHLQNAANKLQSAHLKIIVFQIVNVYAHFVKQVMHSHHQV